MRILFAPYAKRLRDKEGPNPKDFPYAKELIILLEEDGHEVVQIGCEGEEQICKQFLKNKSFQEVTKLLNEFDTFISVDSYLQHHAALLKKRGVVLWGQSDPRVFGHDSNMNLLKNRKYLRKEPFNIWEAVDPCPEAFYSPQEVFDKMKQAGLLNKPKQDGFISIKA